MVRILVALKAKGNRPREGSTLHTKIVFRDQPNSQVGFAVVNPSEYRRPRVAVTTTDREAAVLMGRLAFAATPVTDLLKPSTRIPRSDGLGHEQVAKCGCIVRHQFDMSGHDCDLSHSRSPAAQTARVCG